MWKRARYQEKEKRGMEWEDEKKIIKGKKGTKKGNKKREWDIKG